MTDDSGEIHIPFCACDQPLAKWLGLWGAYECQRCHRPIPWSVGLIAGQADD